MTLSDRLLTELHRLGSSGHPIARRIPGIVEEHIQRAQRVLYAIIVVSLTIGFLLCYAWNTVRIEALSQNVAAWKDQNDTDWRTHHQPVKIGKAAAAVIVAKKEKERE